jgi:hypothetical protein
LIPILGVSAHDIAFFCEPFDGVKLRDGLDICQPAVSRVKVYVTVLLNVITDLYIIMIMLPVSILPSLLLNIILILDGKPVGALESQAATR